MALTRDARSILMQYEYGPLQVWNPSTGDRRTIVPGSDSITFVAPSPDGHMIAAALRSPARLRVYALDGSGPLLTVGLPLPQGVEPVVVAYSPDGRRVAVGTSVGTVHVYVVDQAALLGYARRATNACLRVALRRTVLDESAAEAERAHAACERAHGRTVGDSSGSAAPGLHVSVSPGPAPRDGAPPSRRSAKAP